MDEPDVMRNRLKKKNKFRRIVCYLGADEDVAVERGDLVESGEK